MHKSLIKRMLINNLTNILAILISITILYFIDVISIPLNFSLFVIVLLTTILNIPFIFLNNYITTSYVTYVLSKKINQPITPPIRFKLPFYIVAIIFFLPIISESVVLYILVKMIYSTYPFTIFSAIIVIVMAKSVLLILKPILFKKGVGGNGL